VQNYNIIDVDISSNKFLLFYDITFKEQRSSPFDNAFSIKFGMDLLPMRW